MDIESAVTSWSAEHAHPQETALDAMARAAHQALLDGRTQQPLYQYAGATFAAAWFCGGRVALAHSGDCQIYLRRAGDAFIKLTVDHTLVEEVRRLHPEQWNDELQEKYGNVIVRCLGFETSTSSTSDESTASPPSAWSLTSADARPGDIFLLVTARIAARVDRRAPPFDIEAGETLEGALARYFEALPKDENSELSAAAVRLVDHAVGLVPERYAGVGRMPDLVKKLFGSV